MQNKSHIVRTLETPSQFQGLHIALALSTSRKDKDILSKAIKATNPDRYQDDPNAVKDLEAGRAIMRRLDIR